MDNNWAVAEEGGRSFLSGEVEIRVTGELAISRRDCRHTSDKWRWRERRKLTWLGKDWLWYCRACLRDHQIGNSRDPWYRMEASRRECKGLDVPWRSCSYHQQIWAGRECGRLAQALEMVASIDSFGERQGNLLKGPRVPKFSKP